MNYLLFLYLNLIRGPQIAAERQRQEDEARQRELERDQKKGLVQTCKKCDGAVDGKTWHEYKQRLAQHKAAPKATPLEPLKCKKCVVMEHAEKRAQMQVVNDLPTGMTPFLWFQTFMVCLGLSVFIYRNFVMVQ